MITITKVEHHSVNWHYVATIDADFLAEVYPDMEEDEFDELVKQVEAGEYDIDEIISAAYDAGVDIDWDMQHEDVWTDRKGGYDVTFGYGD